MVAAPKHQRSWSRRPPPAPRQRAARGGQRRSGTHARSVSAAAAAGAAAARGSPPTGRLSPRGQLPRRESSGRPNAVPRRSAAAGRLPTRLVGCTRRRRDDHHRLWSPRRGPPQRSRYSVIESAPDQQTDSRLQVGRPNLCRVFTVFQVCSLSACIGYWRDRRRAWVLACIASSTVKSANCLARRRADARPAAATPHLPLPRRPSLLLFARQATFPPCRRPAASFWPDPAASAPDQAPRWQRRSPRLRHPPRRLPLPPPPPGGWRRRPPPWRSPRRWCRRPWRLLLLPLRAWPLARRRPPPAPRPPPQRRRRRRRRP